MNKLLLLLFIIYNIGLAQGQDQYIDRQGEIVFSSCTSVTNIKATNNQIFSLLVPESNEIVVQVLMKGFVFEKLFMYEHFNESYIESDLHPKAIFKGEIINFDANQKGKQTRIIKGDFTLKGIKKPIEVKASIVKSNNEYKVSGELNILIKDYDIKVPLILSSNIAKNIEVFFKLQYVLSEN